MQKTKHTQNKLVSSKSKVHLKNSSLICDQKVRDGLNRYYHEINTIKGSYFTNYCQISTNNIIPKILLETLPSSFKKEAKSYFNDDINSGLNPIKTSFDYFLGGMKYRYRGIINSTIPGFIVSLEKSINFAIELSTEMIDKTLGIKGHTIIDNNKKEWARYLNN